MRVRIGRRRYRGPRNPRWHKGDMSTRHQADRRVRTCDLIDQIWQYFGHSHHGNLKAWRPSVVRPVWYQSGTRLQIWQIIFNSGRVAPSSDVQLILRATFKSQCAECVSSKNVIRRAGKIYFGEDYLSLRAHGPFKTRWVERQHMVLTLSRNWPPGILTLHVYAA